MTRPLTLRERCPEPGDLITSACSIDPLTVTEVFPLVRAFRVLEIAGMLSVETPWHYIRRCRGAAHGGRDVGDAMTTTLSGIIGDNANLHAGVIDRAELDDMMETTWAEPVDCPACGGSGVRFLSGGRPHNIASVLIAEDCEWCEGAGSCTRAVAGEWEESLR